MAAPERMKMKSLALVAAATVAILGLSLNALVAAEENLRMVPNVPVPMRDGTILAADVYLPAQTGRYPVLLDRSPYGKAGGKGEGVYFAPHGYAVMIQDTRGRYDSDGDWYAFTHEADDGQDTIAWAAHQPWSNGKVVTMGTSYNAMDQWLAATRDNPALAAMITGFCPSDLYGTSVYPGGAFKLGMMSWAIQTGRHTLLGVSDFIHWPELLGHLPVSSALEGVGFHQPFYDDWIDHPSNDAYWQAMGWEGVPKNLDVPVFLYGGWYDLFQKGTMEDFLGIDHSASAAARSAERLVWGPWGHGQYGPVIGDMDFGKQIVVDLRPLELRWLDHYVRGVENGAERDARVDVFVLGCNVWEPLPDWPPPATQPVHYFLNSAGHANTLKGDGALSDASPPEETLDHYTYDPANPAPTHGGGYSPNLIPGMWGVRDQRPVEERSDVLVFTSPPFAHAVEAAGSVTVHLFASSDARDTDWTAKVLDVDPSGYAMNLSDAILRARYHHSFEHPELLTPGEVYEFQIDVGYTDNVFLKGHRLRLEISSSSFPAFSRNTNTGNQPEKDAQFKVAHQTIYHGPSRASYLELQMRESKTAN
ncbi:MAG: CocE/NonD family hydrolase [Terriglobia bacterium]